MEPRAAAEPRRLRADAARNRQRLIDAAEEVFAASGLDATLDDIARHAGVNVATAYRHFANKHELARAYLQQNLDRATAMAEAAAAAEDPMAGLAQFLGQALDLLAANRGFVDVLTNAYGAEWFRDQLHDLITGPIRQLIAAGQRAGVVRPDVDGTDFAVLLPMLASVSDRGVVACVPEPTRRYLALVLAGLRPDGTPLPGRPPTDAELRAAFVDKVRPHLRGQPQREQP
ncbi:MAG: TetR family transcriptional regulator [Trebonia sp.]